MLRTLGAKWRLGGFMHYKCKRIKHLTAVWTWQLIFWGVDMFVCVCAHAHVDSSIFQLTIKILVRRL